MPRTPQPPPIDGILVVDKPRGKTSHDVVEAVRRLVGFRQIGHLGTLDPLATGVLVLALGRATRLARFYAGRRKRYTCAVRFGFATDTYDADGEALGPDSAPALDARSDSKRSPTQFVGKIQQMPPAFSAKKIHGRPAHELARKHKPVKLEPVEVEVFEFRLTGVEGSVARSRSSAARELTFARSRTIWASCTAPARISPKSSAPPWANSRSTRPSRSTDLTEDAKAGKLRRARDSPRKPAAGIAARHRAADHRKARAPRRKIQSSARANSAGPDDRSRRARPRELDSGDWKPSRLRVFNQQGQLIAIAEPVVPRTYQPVVVLEATP